MIRLRRHTSTITGNLDPHTREAFRQRPAPAQMPYIYAVDEVREYTGPAAAERRAQIQREKSHE